MFKKQDLAVWFPLGFALLWSLVLVVGADTVDAIGGSTTGAGGRSVDASHTLIDELGPGGYVVAGFPLLVTIVVAALAASQPRRATVLAALAAVGVLGLLNLAAMLTIGILIIPATAALVLAVSCMGLRLAPSWSSLPALTGDERS